MMHDPDLNCSLCPRLVDFRHESREKFPGKHNAPVPAFGSINAEVLVVGLAPGLKGANFTGRPFTGDWAGDLLYPTLIKFGFATGTYDARPDDGLEMQNCRITNAVRCVPPQNKPIGEEMKNCLPFLNDEIAAMKNLKVLLSLGLVSHQSVIRSFGLKQKDFKFAHQAVHDLGNGLTLIDSYHCSRYNTNTGRLTTEMFENVFAEIAKIINA